MFCNIQINLNEEKIKWLKEHVHICSEQSKELFENFSNSYAVMLGSDQQVLAILLRYKRSTYFPIAKREHESNIPRLCINCINGGVEFRCFDLNDCSGSNHVMQLSQSTTNQCIQLFYSADINMSDDQTVPELDI